MYVFLLWLKFETFFVAINVKNSINIWVLYYAAPELKFRNVKKMMDSNP